MNSEIIYNRDSVQKSLELLNESNNSFHHAGVSLRNAMEILEQVKGNAALSQVKDLSDENTPKNLMTMCDENIGNTISNINRGVNTVEEYIANGGEVNPGGSYPSSGQQQPTPPDGPPEGGQQQPTPPDGPPEGGQQQPTSK